MPKIAILIDGNNFYRAIEKNNSSNGTISDFDFDKFAAFLAGENQIVTKRFYKGVIRKELGNLKSEQMVSAQQSLFSRLSNSGWKVVRGRMAKNSEFGQCKGFYLTDKKIASREELETIGKELLEKYKFSYNPIIVVSDFASQSQIDIKEPHKLENILKSGNLYFVQDTWKEKGVDVNIAIDMLTLAYLHAVDIIVLISNDSDLKPVVERVQDPIGVPVEYIGLESNYSKVLFGAAKKKFLLDEEKLKEFIPQPNESPTA